MEGVFPRDVLPNGVVEFRLLDHLKPMPGWRMPDSLRRLVLTSFNRSVSNLPRLPASLEVLDLGEVFNHPVDRLILPPRLTALRFGSEFNQPVHALQLPASLEELKFGTGHPSAFNRPLVGLRLPDGLRVLRVLGEQYKQAPDQVWPRLPSSLRLFQLESREVMESSWARTEIPPQCVIQIGDSGELCVRSPFEQRW